VISYKLLGSQEWSAIHHSNCGMECFTDAACRSLLANHLETEVLKDEWVIDVGQGPGSRQAISSTGLPSVISDRASLMTCAAFAIIPLIPAHIPSHGFIFPAETGLLIESEAAST
jgi:carbonic anhydrase